MLDIRLFKRVKSLVCITIAYLIFATFIVNGQTLKQLNPVSKQDPASKQKAIIYGNFIQRLGFSSGGFAQDIRIMNVETKEIFPFRVKPTFKSAKENIFCFYLEPGNYVILNYLYTQSKWYGGKIFTEHIYKNVESSKIAEKLKTNSAG